MKATMTKSSEPQNLNSAFTELEKIVGQFEHDGVDLEESLPQFKRGLELAQFLKKRLNQLENEIKTVKAEFEATETKLVDDIEKSETDTELPF